MDKERCPRRRVRAKKTWFSFVLVLAFFFCLFGVASVSNLAEEAVFAQSGVSIISLHRPGEAQEFRNTLSPARTAIFLAVLGLIRFGRRLSRRKLYLVFLAPVRQNWIPLGGQAPPWGCLFQSGNIETVGG